MSNQPKESSSVFRSFRGIYYYIGSVPTGSRLEIGIVFVVATTMMVETVTPDLFPCLREPHRRLRLRLGLRLCLQRLLVVQLFDFFLVDGPKQTRRAPARARVLAVVVRRR